MIDYESCHVIKIFQKNFEFQKLAFFSNKVTPLPQLKGYTALLTLKRFQMMLWNRSLIGWFIESERFDWPRASALIWNTCWILPTWVILLVHFFCQSTIFDRANFWCAADRYRLLNFEIKHDNKWPFNMEHDDNIMVSFVFTDPIYRVSEAGFEIFLDFRI